MKQKVSLGKMQFLVLGLVHCTVLWHPGLLKGGFSGVPRNHLPGTLSPLLWLGGFCSHLQLAALQISPLLMPSCGCYLGQA